MFTHTICVCSSVFKLCSVSPFELHIVCCTMIVESCGTNGNHMGFRASAMYTSWYEPFFVHLLILSFSFSLFLPLFFSLHICNSWDCFRVVWLSCTQYLTNTFLREFIRIWHRFPFGSKMNTLVFGGQSSRGQGHCVLTSVPCLWTRRLTRIKINYKGQEKSQ